MDLNFPSIKKITKHTDSEQVREEMLNITDHQENENQNYNEYHFSPGYY